MPTIIRDADVLDREVGCSPHWSRSESGHERKSFVYPAQLRPERRQISPRSAAYRPSVVTQIAGKAAETLGLTPSQWLRQWCRLDEQA